MASRIANPCDITLSDQHEFLNCAREYQWDQVKRKINSEPGLVNVQPCGREGVVRWSALHQAALSGSLDAVRFLLEHGAATDAVNSDGKTPMGVAKKQMRAIGPE